MATVSTTYYTKQTITIDLAPAGTGIVSGVYRESTVVDNTTDKYVDAILGGSIRTGDIAPTDGATIEIYAYGSWTGDAPYTAGCAGTDGTYTANGEEGLLRLVETIVVDTDTANDYVFGPVSMAGVFGGILPSKWGIVVLNSSGQDLDDTSANHVIEYQGVKYDSA